MLKEGYLTIHVQDMDRAIAFYRDTLGLNLNSRYGDVSAEIGAPGITIDLHKFHEGGPRPGEPGCLKVGFTVDNLDEAMTQMRARGVVFKPEIVEGEAFRLAFFRDRDDTEMYICQFK